MRLLALGPGHSPFLRDCLAPFATEADITVVTTTPPSAALAAAPLDVVRLPRPALRRLPRRLFVHTLDYVAEVWDLALRRVRPDVVHLHYVSQLDALALLPLLRLRPRLPLVLTVWGADVLEDQVPLPWPMSRVVRGLFRRADAVTAKTRFLGARCAALGARPERIHIVPWGLAPGLFRPGDRAAARRALGLPGDVTILASTRTLHPLYQHAVVIDAAARQLDVPTVVMTRAAGDPRHADELAARARERGVPLVLLDPLPATRMAELYAAADAVVSVPASDGLPQTLLEALACGRPVVTLDLEAYRELPFAEDAVVRVPHAGGVADATPLAAGIGRALEARARPGLAEARRWIDDELSWDRSVDAVRTIYRALAAGRLPLATGAIS